MVCVLFFNYCKLLNFLKRKKFSDLSVYLVFLVLLYQTILPLYTVYDFVIPDVDRINVSVHDKGGDGAIIWSPYGVPLNHTILYNLTENIEKLEKIMLVEGKLSVSQSNSDPLLNYTGLIIISDIMDPPPIGSIIYFTLDIEVLKGNTDLSAYVGVSHEKHCTLSEGLKKITITFRYVSNDDVITYDPIPFQLEFNSSSESCVLVLRGIYAVADFPREMVPIKLNFFDLNGRRINDIVIYDYNDKIDFIIAHYRIYLGFIHHYEDLARHIYVDKFVETIYVEPNSTLSNFTISVSQIDKPNVNLTEVYITLFNKGAELDIILPLRQIDLSFNNINSRAIVSGITIFYCPFTVTFSISEWILKNETTREDLRSWNFPMYLLPGKYEIYVSIMTTFEDMSLCFYLNVSTSDLVVDINIYTVSFFNLVVKLDLFLVVLTGILFFIAFAFLILIKLDLRSHLILLLKNPLFIAFLLLLISPLLPSIILKISDPETNEKGLLIILELPILSLYKEENYPIYRASFASILIPYCLISLIFWYAIPLKKLSNELAKSNLERKADNLISILKMSVIPKIIFLFVIPGALYIILAFLSEPVPRILFLIPGPGLILYFLALGLILLEARRISTLKSEIIV